MRSRFIDARVEVEFDGDPKRLAAFTWGGQRFPVTELIHEWSDWGFSPAATRRNWRTRRHRNYYRVQTEGGRVFELYLDRGTKPGRETWVLFQELPARERQSPPG